MVSGEVLCRHPGLQGCQITDLLRHHRTDAGKAGVQGFGERPAPCLESVDKIPPVFTVRGSSLCMGSGYKIFPAGEHLRMELVWADMCLMLSMMRPLSSQKIMFAVLSHPAPPQASSGTDLPSHPVLDVKADDALHLWLMDAHDAPAADVLAQQHAKARSLHGLVLFSSVRYIRGREALAQMHSRLCPAGVLTVRRSSSASG